MQIGLLSDTHSYLDPQLFDFFAGCQEIWHAGDIGAAEVADELQNFRPLRAVYGNIDDATMRRRFPEEQLFDCGGLKIWMIHIGGYPPRYTPRLRARLDELRPDIFICGHSHILKIISDPERKLLHLNPGAAGKHGFHHVRTALRFQIESRKVQKMQVIELGKR